MYVNVVGILCCDKDSNSNKLVGGSRSNQFSTPKKRGNFSRLSWQLVPHCVKKSKFNFTVVAKMASEFRFASVLAKLA